jgi:GT2 family glycosyltransferase
MSPAELPYVSVVVPAWDGGDELSTCLDTLARLDYPADRHEIIVVDSGGDDRIGRIADRYPVRYVREPQPGVAHARNAGIEASRGEIVAFTDTDCAVSTGWLRELVRKFADPAAGAVAGAIVPFPPETDVERYAARRLSHSQLRPLNHPVRPYAMTPNLAFRRDVLARIGMFDTAFPGGGWEDADLCWRFARETGLELRYAPRAAVFHHYRATQWDFFVQHYRYGYGLALLYRKYRGELRWGRRERAEAYAELGATAGKWALRRGVSRFDLLRLLGQRVGFARAALRPGRRA